LLPVVCNGKICTPIDSPDMATQIFTIEQNYSPSYTLNVSGIPDTTFGHSDNISQTFQIKR
jgi:hypothetical protein